MALGAATSAGAAAFTNGGFEEGPALNFGTYARGNGTPTGWSAIPGLETPDIVSNAYNQTGAGFAQLLHSHSGDRYIDPNGASPTGGFFQDVTGLVPLSAITVTFWSGQWIQNAAGELVATLFGQATTSTTVSLPYNPGATSAAWVQYSVTGFASATGTARIQFTGNSGSISRGAPGLDDAVFNGTYAGAVPEPATWGLMIGGFGLAGAMLRRRKLAAG
jgi:hypothetical protein